MPFPDLRRHLHKVVYVYIPRHIHIHIKLVNLKNYLKMLLMLGLSEAAFQAPYGADQASIPWQALQVRACLPKPESHLS